MRVTLAVRNDTVYKGCYRTPDLRGLAKRICIGEGVPDHVEISALFCDDVAMRKLNAHYAGKDEATDVLSFPQPGLVAIGDVRPLGDIAISLETVAHRCGNAIGDMFEETRLLFCHGLLHLLGFDHETAKSKRVMIERQALYLECPVDAAWFRGH